MDNAIILCDPNDPILVDNNKILGSGNPVPGMFDAPINGTYTPVIFIPNSQDGNIPVCEIDCVTSECSSVDPTLCPYGCISTTYNSGIISGCYNSEYAFAPDQCCNPQTTCMISNPEAINILQRINENSVDVTTNNPLHEQIAQCCGLGSPVNNFSCVKFYDKNINDCKDVLCHLDNINLVPECSTVINNWNTLDPKPREITAFLQNMFNDLITNKITDWTKLSGAEYDYVKNFVTLYNTTQGIGGYQTPNNIDSFSDILDSYCNIYSASDLVAEPLKFLLCAQHLTNSKYTEIFGGARQCDPYIQVSSENQNVAKNFQVSITENSNGIAQLVPSSNINQPCKFTSCIFSDDFIEFAEATEGKIEKVSEICKLRKNYTPKSSTDEIDSSVFTCQIADNASCNFDLSDLSDSNIDKIFSLPDFVQVCQGCCFILNPKDPNKPFSVPCTKEALKNFQIEGFSEPSSNNKSIFLTIFVIGLVVLLIFILFVFVFYKFSKKKSN
jgi:hypothetical protein